VQDNSFFKFVPLASSESKEFPIIEEKAVWGIPPTRHEGLYKNTGNGESGWTPLALKDSLTLAQEAIKDLWPEALEWVETLIPAFVDMGVPPSKLTRFSSSYDPGSPIFMSRVDDPLAHAEDVIHEVQHHRLLLFAGTPHFKSWTDAEQVYVSPFRQDPRPLRGLIIGLHAFLTVNELKRRLIEREQASEALVREIFDVHYKNLFAFRTILEHEKFGDFGREVFKQMGHTIAKHHSMVKSFARPELEDSAETRLSVHIGNLQKETSALKNAAPLYRNWNETARLAASFA
jgi:hypothetical protein